MVSVLVLFSKLFCFSGFSTFECTSGSYFEKTSMLILNNVNQNFFMLFLIIHLQFYKLNLYSQIYFQILNINCFNIVVIFEFWVLWVFNYWKFLYRSIVVLAVTSSFCCGIWKLRSQKRRTDNLKLYHFVNCLLLVPNFLLVLVLIYVVVPSFKLF